MLTQPRHGGTQLGGQQESLVFGFEQINDAIGQASPSQRVGAVDKVDGKALDLGLTLLPKPCGDGKPRQQSLRAAGLNPESQRSE